MLADGHKPWKARLFISLLSLLSLVVCARPGLLIAQQESQSAPAKSRSKPKKPEGPGSAGQGGTRLAPPPATAKAGGPITHTGTNAHGGTIGHQVSLKGGGSAHIRRNGQIRSINRNGMHIEHGIRGLRTVVSQHNGARIVSTGLQSGYVQRAYITRGGRSYYSRTYYDHGVYRVAVYRGYYYGGHTYYGFYASHWYSAAFYKWAYQPWPAPVYWGTGAWGWGGAPWYGYYGRYFAPYPIYPSPEFWLTDDLLASNLRSEYAAEMNADSMSADTQAAGDNSATASNVTTLTPEVKRAIAEEVKLQLTAQQTAAANRGARATEAPAYSEVPPALDPAQRTFLVDSDVTVLAGGHECALTAGDVIVRTTNTPDDDRAVKASVLASKNSDCATAETVAVKVDDLQEMYNRFQEQLASALAELAQKQGKGGMPKSPDAGTVASDVPPPEPDLTAANALKDQQANADKVELQVKEEFSEASEVPADKQ
jgi:hypothetical protein